MRREPTGRWSDDRLSLFLLTPERVGEPYVAWLNDPEVNRYLESRFVEQTRPMVEAFVADMAASDRHLFLGITDKMIGRHVGNIKLGPIDGKHGLGEVGIMVGDREAWGRGVGSRAISLLADIAAHELGLRKLTAGCYGSNQGSQKAFEKAGFFVEGVRRAHFLSNTGAEDLILMARFLS